MIWRNPLAWIGLGTLLVPIAVHLLVRMHARPASFPSLRFLQTSRLAAVRRRALSDWPLLAVRLAIVALAVAALADPFFLNDSRRTAWANRTTRAIIVDTTPSVDAAAASAAAAREQASAFEATTIDTTDLRAGVARGLAWLRSAAPAAREIVIASDFQRDSVSESMLSALPSYVGVRFVRVGQPTPRRTVDSRPVTTSAANGQFTVRTPHVTIDTDRTQAQWTAGAAGAAAGSSDGISANAPSDTTQTAAPAVGMNAPFAMENTPAGLAVDRLGLRVQTSDADRGAARAALDAVLSEGVPVARRAERPVVIAIGDAARAMVQDGALPPLAAPWMADALNAVTHDRLLLEVAATTHAADDAGSGKGDRAGRVNGLASRDASTRAGTRADATRSDAGSARGSGDASAGVGAAGGGASSGVPESSAGTSRAPLLLLRGAGGTPLVIAGAVRDGASAAARAARRAAPGVEPPDVDRATRAGTPTTEALVLLSFAPASSDVTPLLIRAALRAIADPDPLPEAEVAAIPDARLDAWRRPAALPPIDELTRVETHDRRWLWGSALVLIAFETWLRRRMRRREPGSQEVAHAA